MGEVFLKFGRFLMMKRRAGFLLWVLSVVSFSDFSKFEL